VIFTIGHSLHPLDSFIALLRQHSIEHVFDVRSTPFSARVPQFNRPVLEKRLPLTGIAYTFFGDRLGGRPTDRNLYEDGQVSYRKVSQAVFFREAIDRLCRSDPTERIALMCSEKEPLECPRFLLVGRALKLRGIEVSHILENGAVESQREVEARLLQITHNQEPDLFAPAGELLERAYLTQSKKVAFGLKAEDIPTID
jgi:uncharacterized protein (DUF488 family)